jgi:hypothetical protein
VKPNRPATLFLIFVGLAIIWFAFGARQIEKWRFYNFRQDRWSTADSGDRWYMAKYLVDKELLVGKTKDEVLDLLGPADESSNRTMGYRTTAQWGSMIGAGNDWLELMFDGLDRSNLVVGTASIHAE